MKKTKIDFQIEELQRFADEYTLNLLTTLNLGLFRCSLVGFGKPLFVRHRGCYSILGMVTDSKFYVNSNKNKVINTIKRCCERNVLSLMSLSFDDDLEIIKTIDSAYGF